MKNVIVDLDGTLANCDHRVHHVRKEDPDWDAFFRECPKDEPNQWCLDLIRMLLGGGYVIHIVSARSRKVLKETISWLDDLFGPHPYVKLHLLREEYDSTPDQELKRQWLHQFEDRAKTLFVVDDRDKVVKMWREEGLTCLQCYSWPEFTTKAPKPSLATVTV